VTLSTKRNVFGVGCGFYDHRTVDASFLQATNASIAKTRRIKRCTGEDNDDDDGGGGIVIAKRERRKETDERRRKEGRKKGLNNKLKQTEDSTLLRPFDPILWRQKKKKKKKKNLRLFLQNQHTSMMKTKTKMKVHWI